MTHSLLSIIRWCCCVLCGLAVFFVQSVYSQLSFESTKVRQKVDPSKDVTEVIIPFKNKGEKSIKVIEVESTCGCLSAQVNRGESNAVYAKGESGHIVAAFKLGSMEGEVSKALYLRSDDPEDTRRCIEVTLDIPKVLEMTPEVTTWAIGSAPTPKTVRFKVLSTDPVEIVGVTSSRTTVGVVSKEIVKGREYELTITPQSTAEPLLGAVRITTNSTVPRFQNKMCFFNVVKQVPAQPTVPPVSAPMPATGQTPAAVPGK